eukprot:scaffold2574_cov98-Cylindrotheca_fusiformis.AAC.15
MLFPKSVQLLVKNDKRKSFERVRVNNLKKSGGGRHSRGYSKRRRRRIDEQQDIHPSSSPR